MKTVLFYARSYLNVLALSLHPYLEKDYHVIYLTQTRRERNRLKRHGLHTVSSFQEYLQSKLWNQQLTNSLDDEIISDLKKVTHFPSDPIQADRFLCHLPTPLSEKIASLIFAYSRSLFQEHAFSALISEPVTMFSTHCLYYQVKINSLKPVFWCSGFVKNTMYFTNGLHLLPNQNLSSLGLQPDFSYELASEYVDGIVNKVIGPVYNAAYSKKKSHGLLSLVRSRKGKEPLILDASASYILYALLRYLRSVSAMILVYQTVDYLRAGGIQECLDAFKMALWACTSYKKPIEKYNQLRKSHLAKRIVFFPLQYEPEASMTYAAPKISSQQDVVKRIIKSLPPNTILVLKEHPNQLGALKLSRWKFAWGKSNVIPLPGKVNARDIIGISYAVLTISSTAGFEAAVMGVPTITFTECHFINLPSVLLVDDIDEFSFSIVEEHADKLAGFSNIKEISILALMENSRYLLRGDPQPSRNLLDHQNLADLASSVSVYVG